ncbi:MAG: putative DNA binding domain-containing protein [Micrococcales bacterium]|nr:putative DNA binding domain-containing protein [Micrococcales bacterium]
MSWDTAALLALIADLRAHGGDSTSVEVKRGPGGRPDLAETLCAFGNMPDGGLIIVGLDEGRDFAPVGVAEPAAMEKGIAAQARTAVVPPVVVSFETVPINGAQIVVAKVAGLPPSARPCRVKGRAYLRQADGDYVMSAQEEQQILALRDRPRHDIARVEGTTENDLDPKLVETFVGNARASSRLMASADDQTLLRRKGVLVPDGPQLTVGGLYALGAYPQQFAPSLSVTAAVVNAPGSLDRLVDLAHFDGPIPVLLDDCMVWLRRNLRLGVRVGADGHNYDHPELPWSALRELVANALVHRDLGPHTQSKRVEIRLREDRLVISNPGGLWGVSRTQLGLPGGKSAVNEYLYGICTAATTAEGARVIEGEGGGIGEVQRALAAWHAEPPIFIDKGVSFAAVLLRPRADSAVAAHANGAGPAWMDAPTRILAAIADGPLDRRAIAESCGLTMSQARHALGKLLKQGLVSMNGGHGARNTTYAISAPG